jgi:translation elongation factor EF-Tu-like GTPase
MDTEEHVGEVTDYYENSHAAAVHVDEGRLEVGDIVHFKGPHTELEEPVESLEINHHKVDAVHEGQDAGIWVRQPVEKGAEVLLVNDPYEDDQAELLGDFMQTMREAAQA